MNLKEGAGNTTINGIQNLGQIGLEDEDITYFDVTINPLGQDNTANPNYFLRFIDGTDLSYILAERVNNDLVIKCSNDEETLTKEYLATKGLLDITTKAFLAERGNNVDNQYLGYNFADDIACTIADNGGINHLYFDKGSKDIAFFFDVELTEDSSVFGSDLYIFATDHNTLLEHSDFESYFYQGADTSGIKNYICIKDAFGDGKMQSINVHNDLQDVEGYETALELSVGYNNYSAVFDTVRSEVASWLQANEYSSVTEALQENWDNTELISTICNYYQNISMGENWHRIS